MRILQEVFIAFNLSGKNSTWQAKQRMPQGLVESMIKENPVACGKL